MVHQGQTLVINIQYKAKPTNKQPCPFKETPQKLPPLPPTKPTIGFFIFFCSKNLKIQKSKIKSCNQKNL